MDEEDIERAVNLIVERNSLPEHREYLVDGVREGEKRMMPFLLHIIRRYAIERMRETSEIFVVVDVASVARKMYKKLAEKLGV